MTAAHTDRDAEATLERLRSLQIASRRADDRYMTALHEADQARRLRIGGGRRFPLTWEAISAKLRTPDSTLQNQLRAWRERKGITA